MIERAVADLLAYAQAKGIMADRDRSFVRNRVLELLRLPTYNLAAEVADRNGEATVDDLLRPILDDAAERGLISPDTTSQRDLWDTAVMACFLDTPSRIDRDFWRVHRADPVAATEAFHHLAVASNYVRVSRTDLNPRWRQASKYGDFEVTINISKPEKDPRDIAAEAGHDSGGYPTCLLCMENEGYAGRSDYPARQNLRLIGMDLCGEEWFFQYSPYRYYDQHCIVLSGEHRPMTINTATFERLSEFAALFPHYLVGSNADLPVVGGSILNHDHLQGGKHTFPMESASSMAHWRSCGVDVDVLNWPLAVIRLTGSDSAVIALASQVLDAWRIFDSPAHGISACSGDVQHNTITPIARRIDGALRMDLVLRNNRATSEHPDGVFHPHAQIHPIKRENIGLIEVLGLAVLPGRLRAELDEVACALLAADELPAELSKHEPMLSQLREGSPAVTDLEVALALTREAAGAYFIAGLEHCGVFGADAVSGVAALWRSIGPVEST